MVGNVPKELRSNKALLGFFEAMCGRGSVQSAISMHDCGEIMSLINDFEEFKNHLDPAPWPCFSKIQAFMQYEKEHIEQRLKAIRIKLSHNFNEIYTKHDNMQSHMGFVTFKSLMDASKMAQKDAFLNLETSPACEPKNIYFENLAVSNTARYVSHSVVFCGLVCLMGF